jgi:ribose/xylose/arabinose/galactoside ABC-type transport system permease subunit
VDLAARIAGNARRWWRNSRMGLNMLNADPQWKVLLTGGLIIAAVAVDQWIRKVSG